MSLQVSPVNIKGIINKLIRATCNLIFLIFGTFLISFSIFPPATENLYLTRSEKEQKMETIPNQDTNQVCLIDKFYVPKNSIAEFTQRLNYNRAFIKSLPGFIKGDAYEKKDNEGNLMLLTVALWKNQEYLNNAKNSVHAEFKRINFEPARFYQRLGVKLERDLYSIFQD